MSIPILMPALSPTMTEGKLAKWHVKVGDTVKSGQVICEIETDKATMDVESPVSGTLLETFFNEGDEVPVMINIAAVGEPGESVDNLWPANATSKGAWQFDPAP